MWIIKEQEDHDWKQDNVKGFQGEHYNYNWWVLKTKWKTTWWSTVLVYGSLESTHSALASNTQILPTTVIEVTAEVVRGASMSCRALHTAQAASRHPGIRLIPVTDSLIFILWIRVRVINVIAGQDRRDDTWEWWNETPWLLLTRKFSPAGINAVHVTVVEVILDDSLEVADPLKGNLQITLTLFIFSLKASHFTLLQVHIIRVKLDSQGKIVCLPSP